MGCRLLWVLGVLLLVTGCAISTEPGPSDARVSPEERPAAAQPATTAQPTTTAQPATTARPHPSAAAPASRCAPVMLLGVRGSGQPAELGADVDDLVRRLTERSGAAAFNAEAVRYSPSPFGAAVVNPGSYAVAVSAGAEALRHQTDGLRQRCPDARAVLVVQPGRPGHPRGHGCMA